ncbi:MAG TPA: hypothetical protein VJ672_13325 [Gemmatimonadaceae bacterium]|nr:hypothetical protein [Gemmatimonadaceae bacterium]
MTEERSGAARVISQEGDRVHVEHRGDRMTVPMRGFPPGFKLRPGRRVILRDEEGGVVARPLVRAITARLSSADAASRGAIQAEGRQLEMQPSTVVDERETGAERPATEEYDIWVVERTAEGEPAEQVIAARRRR